MNALMQPIPASLGLARYDAARHALEAAVAVDEVKVIRDKALAIAAYAKQADDKQMIEWATEIKVRAERKCGLLLAVTDKNRGAEGIGKSAVTRDNRTPLILSDLGVTKAQSSRWQKLAAVPEDQFEQAVSAAKEIAGEVTLSGILATHNHRAQGTGENEWYTPPKYIEKARSVMGSIDLDPASSIEAQKVVRAAAFVTKDDDGLTRKWTGNVWLNPPYSQPAIAEFAEHACQEWSAGRITSMIVLTHNYTDTAWFQQLAAHASVICFTRGRIAFESPHGKRAAATQGQAFSYFGANWEKFTDIFKDVGFCVRTLK